MTTIRTPGQGPSWGSILSAEAQSELAKTLEPLKGAQISHLLLPVEAAAKFEPSQIGTIIGTLTDALLPYIALEQKVGLTKSIGILGDREGYPDFVHEAGYRLELKGVFKDNPDVQLKKPPTPREPSARLTQKVTVKNVINETDALLVLVYQLQPYSKDPSLLTPTVIDFGIFPVIECVQARDHRLTSRGGRWFGNYETPAVLSKSGKRKMKTQTPLNTEVYGRKESEGYDFNEDTNFGKLKRIPFKPLQELLAKHGCAFAAKGEYPASWRIVDFLEPTLLDEVDEDDDDATP